MPHLGRLSKLCPLPQCALEKQGCTAFSDLDTSSKDCCSVMLVSTLETTRQRSVPLLKSSDLPSKWQKRPREIMQVHEKPCLRP